MSKSLYHIYKIVLLICYCYSFINLSLILSQACRDIFRSRSTPFKQLRSIVENVCNDNNTNTKVLQCVQNFTDSTPFSDSKKCN